MDIPSKTTNQHGEEFFGIEDVEVFEAIRRYGNFSPSPKV
tara:strand:- start:778 stop:897 length:120 start_codon:yes stop_codon:yes gene_type:complete